MNTEQIETIRAETFALLDARNAESRALAYERFLDGIAGDIKAKANVTPLWAADGLYRTAEQVGEAIILRGEYNAL